MPPESGSAFMSSSVVVSRTFATRFQCTRSFEACTRTPGNHSNVDTAMKYSSPTRTMLGSGLKPGSTGFAMVMPRTDPSYDTARLPCLRAVRPSFRLSPGRLQVV